jgi:hypothetical protein
MGLLLLRFFAREVDARAGFWMLVIVTATPLLAVGATLMTIDPLSVLFWTAAMLIDWQAVRKIRRRIGFGPVMDWLRLSQQIPRSFSCSAGRFLFIVETGPNSTPRPGPYLATLVIILCPSRPDLEYARQVTVSHLANRGGLQRPWEWQRSFSFLRDFLLAETALLNPFFFVAAVWAAVSFWKEHPRDPLLLFLFSMGAPLFLFYGAYTLRARVLPNWIAPAVLPLFCVMLVYWYRRWNAGFHNTKPWLMAGLVFGFVAVVLLHDTNLIAKVAGRPLPASKDPLRRVRGWREAARLVEEARRTLLAEGKPVVVIGDHYGITGLLSFYIPEAKRCVKTEPIVYYQASAIPENQFFFWPSYANRKGGNAIFVQTTKEPSPAPSRIQRNSSR